MSKSFQPPVIESLGDRVSKTMSLRSSEAHQPLSDIIAAAVAQAHGLGVYEGFQAGRVVGYVEGVAALTPAISDGLRHGSSECAKAMQSLKNIKAIPENDEED